MNQDRDLVRRIKDQLDIVDVLGSYIELKKQGTRYVALCPFHAEKAPSFSVQQQNQLFHCFGCKTSGDIFDFVMAMEGISFREALEILAERCGLEIEAFKPRQQESGRISRNELLKILEAACCVFEENLQADAGAEARRYLETRGFQQERIVPFRLGFATDGWRGLFDRLTQRGVSVENLLEAGLIKKSQSGRAYDLFRNRLIIPIFDMQGRVVGFGGRVLDGSEPKYINSPETEVFRKSRLLYGLNRARQTITSARTAVVVEGYTDVIMAHNRGMASAVATLGTALTDEHARTLRRLVDRVLLLFDGDGAGKAAAERGVEILLAHDLDVSVLSLPRGTDPCDFFRDGDSDSFWSLAAEEGTDFFDFSIRALSERHDLSAPGGRTRIARGLFRLVAALGDSIKQDLVLRRIAESLDIREDLLRAEFLKQERGKAGISPRVGAARPAETTPPEETGGRAPGRRGKAEEDLIRGILMNPSLIGDFAAVLEDIRIEGETERALFDLLLDYDGTGEIDSRELLAALCDNEPARRRLIDLLAETRRVDAAELVAESLKFLRTSKRENEYSRLREAGRKSLRGGGGEGENEHLADIHRRLKEKNCGKNAVDR
jgi:DNA primase